MKPLNRTLQIGTLVLALYTMRSNVLADSNRDYIAFSGEPKTAELNNGKLSATIDYKGEPIFASTHTGNKEWDATNSYKVRSLQEALHRIRTEITDNDKEPITLLGYWWFTGDGYTDRFVIEGLKANGITYILEQKK